MKKLLTALQIVFFVACILFSMPTFATVDSNHNNFNDAGQQTELPEVHIVADLGICIGDCASEQGICISQCQGDGQCISNCAAAHGRCVARCHSRQ